jgi:hypothetical protein
VDSSNCLNKVELQEFETFQQAIIRLTVANLRELQIKIEGLSYFKLQSPQFKEGYREAYRDILQVLDGDGTANPVPQPVTERKEDGTPA